MHPTTRSLFAVLVLVFAPLTWAEELDKIFAKIDQYVKQENYPKAIEELAWARKEIDKLNFKKIETLLPKELEGFAGQPSSSQSTLGFSSLTKNYTKGSDSVKLTLSGGGAGGARGGLAGIAQMAMMLGGQQPGRDTFRIQGRTATLEAKPNTKRVTLTIMLESGSMLQLQSNRVDKDTVKKMGESIEVEKIDKYFKGQG